MKTKISIKMIPRVLPRNVITVFVVILCPVTAPAQEAGPEMRSTAVRVPVGMVGRVSQVVIPGGELQALPVTDPLAKVIVRVAETYPHGESFRYDLEFTGFEPGRYDLTRCLARKNADESMAGIAPIEVEVTSVLEPGRLEPARPGTPEIRPWWKYWTKLNIFIGCWIFGLAMLFTWSNRASRAEAVSAALAEAPPPTVAERLRPLVQAARDGTIAPHARAELEALLIAYWGDRLHLNDTAPPGMILSELKQHADAGPLVSKLEEWLHMPPGQSSASGATIAELLKPYESVMDSTHTETLDRKGKGGVSNDG